MFGLVFERQKTKANPHTRPKRDLVNFLTFMHLIIFVCKQHKDKQRFMILAGTYI